MSNQEDRVISERTIPSLRGQPAIPETPITEADWQRERDRRDTEEGLEEMGYQIETFHWSETEGSVPVYCRDDYPPVTRPKAGDDGS